MWVKEEAMVTIILMGMRYFSRTKPKEFDDVQKQISTNTGECYTITSYGYLLVCLQVKCSIQVLLFESILGCAIEKS